MLTSGVMLEVLPTTNIREYSNMTRGLCVELVGVGDGLERGVSVDLEFTGMGYSRTSKQGHHS